MLTAALSTALLRATAPARAAYAGARRPIQVGAVVLVVAYVYAQAPSGQQFLQFTVLGIAAGCIYAIAASGLVLTYATTGIFNFAHGGIGMLCAFTYWQLTAQSGLPAPLGFVIVLGVMAPLIGLGLELMFRRFKDADVGTSIVLTIAVTIFCIGVAQQVWKRDVAHNLPFVFGDRRVEVFDAILSWDQLLQLTLAVAVAVGLRALLYRSRTGVAMRAVVDNPTLAGLNGAPPTRIARASWILGAELAALAGILIGSGQNLEAITLTFLVASAYGAAVFGRLRSLPLTFAGAIALGLLQNWSSFALPESETFRRIGVGLPGIFLFLALLALPQAKLAVGRVVGRQTPRAPSLAGSIARAGLFLAAMVAVSGALPTSNVFDVTQAVVFAVIVLSLVVLTGFSGQVSLAQYVFLAIGAWAMGSTFGGASILGLLVAGLAAVPLGILVALPALRLQGLYLALVTFGFAIVANDVILDDPRIYGRGDVTVGRPEVFGLDFAGDRAYLLLCSVVFAAFGVFVVAVKRGPFGRRLAALRDSQAACATLGLDVRRTKLAVFCLSAFMAGVAGALFGGLSGVPSSIDFEEINNIVLFLFAVVGGITTVTGAAIGGSLFVILPIVQSKRPELAGLVFVLVAAASIGLGRQPNGLAGFLFDKLRPYRAGAPAVSGARRVGPTPRPAPTAGAPAAAAHADAMNGTGSGEVAVRAPA